eukprot:SAG11_NODE_35146_length_268_cov_0.609467_1_plen_29_part_01
MVIEQLDLKLAAEASSLRSDVSEMNAKFV